MIEPLEVEGVADTIRYLREVDPDLRKELVREMKAAAKPLIGAARSMVPASAPLSQWGSWPRGQGFDAGKARRSITATHRSSARRGSDTIPLLTLQGKDAGLMVFDMAGRKSRGRTAQGRAFIRNLENRYGPASRLMWPAVEAGLPAVHRHVREAIDTVAADTNRKMRT